MPNIRHVFESRNNFTKISRIVPENNESIFLTKNAFGEMVVMSIGQYQRQSLIRKKFKSLSKRKSKQKTMMKDVHRRCSYAK